MSRWRALLSGLAAGLLLSAMAALAQPAPASQGAASDVGAGGATAAVEAPVVVLNRTVAVFRSPFLGVPPQERARRSASALQALLDRGGPGAVTVQREPQGHALMLDGQVALFLTGGDVDAAAGQTLDDATRSSVDALTRVIAETREGRDRGRLLRGAGQSVLATLAFVLAWWGMARTRRWLVPRLAHLLSRLAAAVRIAGTEVVPRQRVQTLSQWLVDLGSILLLFLLLYQWLSYVLVQFPYTRPWGEGLHHYLFDVGRRLGGGVLRALPNLFVAFIIFALARTAIALAAPLFDRFQSGRDKWGLLDSDTARPTRRIFSVGVWLFAIAMAYPYLPGSQSDAFRGVSVLVGLMLSIGGSSVLGHGASGLIMMYSRVLRLGEYVRIGEHEGMVTELGTFTTKIRTGIGEEITLPNALILANVTKNYSRTVQGPGCIVDTTVTIGYDTPWRQVEAMLTEAALRTPGVLAQPKPQVFQTALSDFYPQYQLVCQAGASEPRPRVEILAKLHANIQDVFNEHSVQIMSPHYRGDPPAAKIVPKALWFAAPAIPDRGDATEASRR